MGSEKSVQLAVFSVQRQEAASAFRLSLSALIAPYEILNKKSQIRVALGGLR